MDADNFYRGFGKWVVSEPCGTCDGTGDDGTGNECATCGGTGWESHESPGPHDPPYEQEEG